MKSVKRDRSWAHAILFCAAALLLVETPASAQNPPCCTITAVDGMTGSVTARVNQSGQAFTFALPNQQLPGQVKVGQGVYANFKTKQVSLDGRTVCCAILSVGSVAARPQTSTLAIPTSATTTSVPDFVSFQGGDGVQAANELMALPWAGLADQYTKQGKQTVIDTLQGKPVAKGYTDLPGNSRLSFELTMQNVAAQVNIASPPGFRYASLSGTAGQKPGFVFQAPLNAYWGFGVQSELRGKVEAYGQKLFDGSVPINCGVSKLRLTAAAQLDTTQPDRPALVKAYVYPELVLNLLGQELPINVLAKIQDGKLIFPTRVTNLGFDLGGLATKLTADLVLTIWPRQYQDTFDATVGAEGIASQDIHLSAAFQDATLALKGELAVTVKDPFGNKHDSTIPIAFAVPVGIPSNPQFNQALLALQPPLPRPYPQVDGPADNVRADFSKLSAASLQLESLIDPRHMPYGAILMIDRRPPDSTPRLAALQTATVGPRSPAADVPETYGRLWDSAIWTGHYLAAEAFRYAATNDSEALARVQKSLQGIRRLFWVTGDAVVTGARVAPVPRVTSRIGSPGQATIVDGQIAPVGRPGLLARSALPNTSPIGWWEGTPPRKADGSVPCYYMRPEGGWRIGSRIFPTYGDALRSVGGPLMTRSSPPEPVGVIWYGVGCGKMSDQPVSRDQYDGVMMGLAYAYQLVSDVGVRTQIRDTVDAALNAIVTQDAWSLKSPPAAVISTTWFGNFDMQLDFLRVGATVHPERWLGTYQQFRSASALTWIPEWFASLDCIPGYYGFNLSHALFGPLLFLEDDPQSRQNYLNAYRILRTTTEKHRNAYFDLVRILVERPADRAAVAAAVTPEIQSLLSEWLMRLQKVAGPNGLPTNAMPDPGAFVRGWQNVQMYQTLQGGTPLVTKYAFPVQLRAGDTDFMWEKNPFSTGLHANGNDVCAAQVGIPPSTTQIERCASAAWREGAGIDYLLPYWLATYLGVLRVTNPSPVASVPDSSNGGGQSASPTSGAAAPPSSGAPASSASATPAPPSGASSTNTTKPPAKKPGADGPLIPPTTVTASEGSTEQAIRGIAPNAGAPAACCVITSVDVRNNVASAKVTATGQSFQFRANKPADLASVRVGESVYANFAAHQVSLDGRSTCCTITSMQARSASIGPFHSRN